LDAKWILGRWSNIKEPNSDMCWKQAKLPFTQSLKYPGHRNLHRGDKPFQALIKDGCNAEYWNYMCICVCAYIKVTGGHCCELGSCIQPQ
jgi:hypothetical protein